MENFRQNKFLKINYKQFAAHDVFHRFFFPSYIQKWEDLDTLNFYSPVRK